MCNKRSKVSVGTSKTKADNVDEDNSNPKRKVGSFGCDPLWLYLPWGELWCIQKRKPKAQEKPCAVPPLGSKQATTPLGLKSYLSLKALSQQWWCMLSRSLACDSLSSLLLFAFICFRQMQVFPKLGSIFRGKEETKGRKQAEKAELEGELERGVWVVQRKSRSWPQLS